MPEVHLQPATGTSFFLTVIINDCTTLASPEIKLFKSTIYTEHMLCNNKENNIVRRQAVKREKKKLENRNSKLQKIGKNMNA